MLRHAIAPVGRFTQVPHEILRHPRLGSDAVRLLTWQLSLPDGVDEPLSKTAERAGLRNFAFNRAKKQLKAEGYVHEWREQGERGRWRTEQLVSNVPLTPEEAARARNGGSSGDETGEPPTPPTPPPPAPPAPPTPPPPPTPAPPTAEPLVVGEPEGPSVGGHPENTPVGNTSNPPPPPEARRVLDELTALDPRLRVPRAMLPQLTDLVARWLDGGHSPQSVREEVQRCLPGRGTPIHRPGGLLRYVLREVAPVPVAEEPPPPPRVASMRECEGTSHIQPLLFTPHGDEELCGGCRSEQAASAGPEPAPVGLRGAALLRAAMAR
ncbi:hypothetical protein ACGFMM_04260 [Streptomyces sp. NPDC048604]|uniref:hypothetical protein n=1 Tax=Streptomyces sp. NPDC048604 TaxID=3365578 RepID=UPI0037171EEA